MSTKEFDYATAVTRNSGYIDEQTQAKMRASRLLIAGCGIGSSLAVGAARMGFENFILVDGDTVDAHNLNRQFYDFADAGALKVDALKDKILRINPQARVEAIGANLDAGNTAEIVARADIVFDTVDFLDLPAILSLHTTAKALGKPLFTALNVGFGALVWYFPAHGAHSIADILAPDVAKATTATGQPPAYADVFASFIERLAPYLDQEVLEQVSRVLEKMRDGKPCPASQVAVGSFAVSAMAMSMIRDMLSGNPLPESPKLVIHSFKNHQTTLVDLSA